MYSYTVPIVLDSQKERFSKVLTLKKGGFLNPWQSKKEIFPTLDKKKKLNPCSLTKEKAESHLLDNALFLYRRRNKKRPAELAAERQNKIMQSYA